MGFFDGVKNVYKFFVDFPDPADLYGTKQEYQEEIEKRREYRAGEQKKQLRVKLGKPDDNLRSNMIGKIVDQSVYLLLSSGVEFDLPGEEETPEEQWLNACWKANKKDIFLKDCAYNAADAGIGYIKIQPNALIGQYGEQMDAVFPRLINIDPKNMTVDTNPEDFEQVIRYTIEFVTAGPDNKPRRRREITEHVGASYDENGNATSGEYWEISNWVKDYGKQWDLMDTPVIWADEQGVPYDFPPIIHGKNLPNPNNVIGRPDIMEDVLELQDKRNFNASNINKIIRYHAHPKTYGIDISPLPKSKDSTDSSWDPDQMVIFTGGTNPKIANLEMQSDLASSIQFYDMLGKQMFDQTNTVDVTAFRDKLGQLTNFSVRVLFQEAIWKMNIKRELFGDMLRELNHRLLVVGGQANTDPGEIVWPDAVLPVNVKEVIEEQKAELAMGIVSKQTISQERGRDYEQEQERMSSEQANDTNIGAEILKTFEAGVSKEAKKGKQK